MRNTYKICLFLTQVCISTYLIFIFTLTELTEQKFCTYTGRFSIRHPYTGLLNKSNNLESLRSDSPDGRTNVAIICILVKRMHACVTYNSHL